MDGSTDLTELIERARAGDEAACEQLFEKCRAYVGVVARAQVESWMQAKVDSSDIVQQTLLEAYRGLTQFQGTTEREWLAWLRRILDHNATDFVRRYRGTRKRQALREVPLHHPTQNRSTAYFRDPSDPGQSPSELAMQHEDQLQVAEAVDRLDEDYREVVMLRNLQRLPFDEVARRMGRSRPAVQMLWMRAIRRLRELMGKSD